MDMHVKLNCLLLIENRPDLAQILSSLLWFQMWFMPSSMLCQPPLPLRPRHPCLQSSSPASNKKDANT
eukprot:3357180-Amphidinium_carterae.1